MSDEETENIGCYDIEKISSNAPKRLREQCLKRLINLFTQASAQEQKVMRQKIQFVLPFDLIELLAEYCLEKKIVAKELPCSVQNTLSFSGDHRYLATYFASLNEHILGYVPPLYIADNSVQIYDLMNPRNRKSFSSDKALLSEIVLSPLGNYCAYIRQAECADIIIHDLNAKTCISLEKEYRNDTAHLVFSDEHTLIINSRDILLIYNINTQQEREVRFEYFIDNPILLHNFYLFYFKKLHNNNQNVFSLESLDLLKNEKVEHVISANLRNLISDKREQIAFYEQDAYVHVWHINVQGEIVTKKILNTEVPVDALAFDSTSSSLATCAQGMMRIWNVHTCTILYEIALQISLAKNTRFLPNFLSWSIDGKEILITCKNILPSCPIHYPFSYYPRQLTLGLLLKKFLTDNFIKDKNVK